MWGISRKTSQATTWSQAHGSMRAAHAAEREHARHCHEITCARSSRAFEALAKLLKQIMGRDALAFSSASSTALKAPVPASGGADAAYANDDIQPSPRIISRAFVPCPGGDSTVSREYPSSASVRSGSKAPINTLVHCFHLTSDSCGEGRYGQGDRTLTEGLATWLDFALRGVLE